MLSTHGRPEQNDKRNHLWQNLMIMLRTVTTATLIRARQSFVPRVPQHALHNPRTT